MKHKPKTIDRIQNLIETEKTQGEWVAPFDHVSFSIVQLPSDQNSTVPSQRILQIVTRNGETKSYVTESSYFRGETYAFFAAFVEKSFDKSIRKDQVALSPVDGGRYWVRFNEDTLEGKEQKRASPENFE